jgi:Putative redox-active protein (C_GCAxxG_C_C)
MQAFARRDILTTLGLSIVPATLVLGQDKLQQPTGDVRKLPWRYVSLVPDETADRAYAAHVVGGCMYGVFVAIVGQLAEQHGEPYRNFPMDLMRYGAGGLPGQGSLCGGVNGAAAVLALFAKTSEDRGQMTRELCRWYQEARLPLYVPKAGQPAAEAQPTSIAQSLLCKDSIASWAKATGRPPESAERGERCRRLTADVARKTVQLLNASAL